MTNLLYGYRSDSELFEKAGNQCAIWRNTRTLISGFLETKSVYDNGTAETRSILVKECSLIYECNVCQNLFRCLANFIKHKRLYCCTSFDHMNCIKGNDYQDEITDKKANEKQEVADGSSESLSNHILKMATGKNKKKATEPEDASDEGEKRQGKLQTKDSSQKNWKFRSRPMRNFGKATKNDSDIRGVGITDIAITPKVIEKTLRSPSNRENMCDACERKFETKKSLKMHILKKHKPQKYEFQCPSCSLTFLQPTAVVQHLNNDHKKPIRCINLMRGAIQKRRVLNEETFMKTEDVLDSEKDVPKQESIIDNASSCDYCKKSFLRKAVLLAHQNSCRLRTTYSSGNYLSDQSKNKKSLSEEFEPFAIPLNVSLNDSNKSSTDQSNASVPSSDDFKIDSTQTSPLKCSNDSEETSGSKRNYQLPKSKYMPCLCKICNKHFSALSNLRRHISMIHYRTRKFACKLCDYRAFRKYDVINHLGHIHKILGDKETMSLEYIGEHVEPSFRETFDEDIILVTNDQKAKSMEDLHVNSSNVETSTDNVLQSPLKSEEIQNKNLKPYSISSHVQKSASRNRQKLKRSISQQFGATLDPRVHKRPKRNRITPVEKDFVYDLSTILKNEVNEKERESGRYLKRRDTVLLSSTPGIKCDETALYRPLTNYSVDLIKGCAQKTAVLSVHQGRAAYSSIPLLPSKRPQVRMRHATIHRPDFVAAPEVNEAIDIKEERLQTKLLDDSFLENLSKAASADFKMKPRLALPQSTINSLLNKVDQKLQNQNRIKSEERYIELVESIPKINFKREISIEEVDEKFSHAQSCDVGPAFSKCANINQNHFEIMQCLVANKPQNSESLLRLALEN